jgi:hypothetical protein
VGGFWLRCGFAAAVHGGLRRRVVENVLAVPAEEFDALLERVDAREQLVGDGLGDGHLAGSHVHEQVLHVVGEFAGGGEAEHGGAPLDRMKRTEDAVDDFLFGVFLQVKQIPLGRFQQFEAVAHEIVYQLSHLVHDQLRRGRRDTLE